MHNKNMNKNKPIKNNSSRTLWYYGLAGILFWTALVCLSVFWHQKTMHLGAIEAARIEAREAFQNHLTDRSLNADHERVYAPVTEYTQPNHFILMYVLLWLIGVLGSIFFMVALNQQRKKRIQVEEELRKKDKLAGVIEMARAVCHELNQPLQTIMGNTEILMMEDIDQPDIKKRINLIKDQADRMGKMTRKIIEIANYETMDLPQGKVIDIEKSSKPLESFKKKE